MPCRWLFPTLLLLGAPLLFADTIDFEGFTDSTFLSTQYTGLIFSSTQVVSAGISLNDLDFPPRSGTNVAFDAFGPMSIVFSLPVTSFGGYFTYAEPVTLRAYGITNNLLGSVSSTLLSNFVSSGNGSPNEFLNISLGQDIFSVTMAGNPSGSSFTMDDLEFAPSNETVVPEPSHFLALLICFCTLGIASWRRFRESI